MISNFSTRVKIVLFFIITISSTVIFASGEALDPNKKITQYILDVWQTEDGLPQNSIQEILQTNDGYLVFATQEGLAFFDGVKFEVINKKNTPELKNNYITALYQDSKGKIWIGTDGGGITVLDGESRINYSKESGIGSNFISAICEDNSGNIWIATDGSGLSKYSDGIFTIYNNQNGYSFDVVQDLIADDQGNIWLATPNGLQVFNSRSSTKIKLGSELDNIKIWKIEKAGRSGLWLGTNGKGVVHYSFNGDVLVYNTENGLSNNIIRSVYVDKVGALWAGSLKGLNRIYNGNVQHFTISDGLSNDNVTALASDKEGSLWVGTNGGGLDRLRDGKCITYTTKEGLKSDFIWTVFQDSKGAIWAGTDGGGLNKLVGDKVTTYTTANGLGSNVIFPVMEDKEGSLWVGTNGGGLSVLKNGRFKTYKETNGLPSNTVKALYQQRDGTIWIGTTKGICLMKDGKIGTTVYDKSNGLPADYIRVIYGDSKGNIWIGTRGGGAVKYSNGYFKVYDKTDGLSNNIVRCFYEDNSGVIWIGTSAGLNRLKNETIKSITTDDGLFDDPVFSILEDRKGNFWMSCNKGIYYTNKSELNDFCDAALESVTTSSFGKNDGMRSSECNGTSQPAGYKDNRGNLWFPTIKGLVTINPERLDKNEVVPPVIIEEFLVDGVEQNLNEEITIEAGNEKFEFHYTGLSFMIPKKVNFMYMLEGFDKDWVDAGNRRTAYYTNIAPGKYKFKVKACNNDGIWNEAGTETDFYFEAYFYQTYWFWAIVVVIIGYISFRLYKSRMDAMKKQHHEMEKQYELAQEQKKQLEEKESALKEQMVKTEKIMANLEEEKRYLKDSVDNMLSEIEKFSQGDLTVYLASENEDEIAMLYNGFNLASERISEMFARVQKAVHDTIESNQLILDQTNHIAKGIENQTMEAAEVASAVEEMARSIHENTKNAGVAAESAKDAGEFAKEGGEIVSQTITGMNKIAKVVLDSSQVVEELGVSSSKIGDIVQVINDIADQTNLLALNAAIEAARAGEQGRGFAVVADEVRKLAERTTKATKEISMMIKEIQTNTERAVDSINSGTTEVEMGKELANKANDALKKIIENSHNISDIIDQVAAASEQQSQTGDEISRNIENISNVSRESTSAIHGILESVSHHSESTINLSKLVNHFKVKDNLLDSNPNDNNRLLN